MVDDTLIVLDFETTGLSPEMGDRITEVAAIKVSGNKILDSYDSLVNCGIRLSPFIVSYTGITQRMIDGAPPPKNVMRNLLKFVGNIPVVAHNSSFDYRFYSSECRHVGAPAPDESFLCSMRLARRVFPGLASYSLGNLAAKIGVAATEKAHRARADAMVTAKVLFRIGEAIRSRRRDGHVGATLLRRIMDMPIASALSRIERQGIPR